MKQRFSALDVSASVAELKTRLVGLRLQNIYDINSKTYLFKFSQNETKELLLVESAIRMHTTQFSRNKSQMPSNFCVKLRKHLRTRRLVDLRQLGADRIIDMQFSKDEYAFHIIVELYSSGNIILTDHLYRIMSVLRTVEYESSTVSADMAHLPDKTAAALKESDAATQDLCRIAVGQIYPTHTARQLESITPETLLSAIHSAGSKDTLDAQSNAPTQSQLEQDHLVLPGSSENGPSAATLSKKQKHTGKKSGKPTPIIKTDSKKKKQTTTLKAVLRHTLGPNYGASLIEHCIKLSGLSLNMTLPNDDLGSVDSPQFTALFNAFVEGDAILSQCTQFPQKGYIVSTVFAPLNKSNAIEGGTSEPLIHTPSEPLAATLPRSTYLEFHPYPFLQFTASADGSDGQTTTNVAEFASFDKAIDEFFSKMESQKLDLRAHQAEAAAAKKLESVKSAHATQIRNFQQSLESNEHYALAIETHLEAIDSVLQTVQSFLASGMDWKDLENLVREETSNGNAMARMIVGFKLQVGMITVELANPNSRESESDDEDADESDSSHLSDHDDCDGIQGKDSSCGTKSAKTNLAGKKQPELLRIDLDICLTAHANARRYYGAKKVAASKQIKTMETSSKVFKTAERKILQTLAAVQQTAVSIIKTRKLFWFEKFMWFISSENYLVVCGRDASQNEMLVERYLRKGDAYIYSDLPGAASVIVKYMHPSGSTLQSSTATDDAGPEHQNLTTESTQIPPTTLLQAGTMSVCQSRAWDSKIVTAAYWVEAHQVSKTSPTGEALSLGTFMIRGKKNWLPPVQLVYGMALLFQVDPSCAEKHYWERRPWGRDGISHPTLAESRNSAPASHVVIKADTDSDAGVDEDAVMDSSDVEEAILSDPPLSTAAKLEPVQDLEDPNCTPKMDSLVDSSIPNSDGDDGDDNDDNDDVNQDSPSLDRDAVSAARQTHLDTQQTSKYDFEDDAVDEFANALADVTLSRQQLGSGSGTKHLSAKARRLLRKGKSGNPLAADSESNTSDTASIKGGLTPTLNPEAASSLSNLFTPSSRSSVSDLAKPASPAISSVRGKTGKIKKAKNKYADQDEEDRALVLDFLGSAKGPQPKGKKAKAHQAKKAEEERRNERYRAQDKHNPKASGSHTVVSTASTDVIRDDGGGIDSPGIQIGAVDVSMRCEDVQKGASAHSSSGRVGESKPKRSTLSAVDEDHIMDMSCLDLLTGQPHPDDIVLHAIPVCAPWTALSKYKYKVKLLPGSLKRGKAAKSIATSFISMATSSADPAGDSKKDLIKSIPDAEWIAALLGKVKIVISATDQAQMKNYSGGKDSKRNGK
ncbi:hypothetical protein BSLG_006397 [Batrachochytrium salamandrivorans]|nr:hypothetical protein BASA60_005879 [Batrachochytrium salamandrivorans]KAH9269585.1 hypothetical protein BASA83_008406 [Batrachochytrium salamandrivorans]KAJ1339263.1 hypothetical protein BSLG_006397 [Batrachochytrium salamandrivorans]